ncbi:hypothetical protein H6504_00675 [Candidatus Woesearchaeota archaeon]|nr:hypothetical protein [Candidatus Woesearchaeota archaeon]
MVILFDRYHLPEDVLDIVFATKQQKIVAQVLVKFIAEHGGSIGKTEMSYLATTLHEGKYEAFIDEEPYRGKKVRLSYNKRQFYDRILTPMKTMGLVDYDMYKKTYHISDKFYNEMMRIGLMWKNAVSKMGIQK